MYDWPAVPVSIKPAVPVSITSISVFTVERGVDLRACTSREMKSEKKEEETESTQETTESPEWGKEKKEQSGKTPTM